MIKTAVRGVGGPMGMAGVLLGLVFFVIIAEAADLGTSRGWVIWGFGMVVGLYAKYIYKPNCRWCGKKQIVHDDAACGAIRYGPH